MYITERELSKVRNSDQAQAASALAIGAIRDSALDFAVCEDRDRSVGLRRLFRAEAPEDLPIVEPFDQRRYRYNVRSLHRRLAEKQYVPVSVAGVRMHQ